MLAPEIEIVIIMKCTHAFYYIDALFKSHLKEIEILEGTWKFSLYVFRA